MALATDYRVERKTVGRATPNPREVYGITCVIECECPVCPEGEHRVDAFNRGSGKGWYESEEEAQEVVRKLWRY